MKKFLSAMLMIALAFTAAFSLFGCAENISESFVAEGAIYSKGTQTVTVRTKNETVTFSDKVSAADFSLSSELGGKTVTGVSFVNNAEIKIELTGTLSSTTASPYEYYKLTANKHAFNENASAEILVTVYQHPPMMNVTGGRSSKAGGKYSGSNTFSLDYGSFITENCTAENITLIGNNGEIASLSATSDSLYIYVKNYVFSETEPYPAVKISADCTTFNHEVIVSINGGTGLLNSYEML